MISDKFANINQMQKITFIPRKIKSAKSVIELYAQKEKKGSFLNYFCL